MKIAIAADHGGFELKEILKKHFAEQNTPLDDLGTFSNAPVDYPDFAHQMAHCITEHKADLGILICGTGIGISIAANRHKGIRAALLYSDFAARMAKEHNNANILVFGGRTMSAPEVINRCHIFLNASFQGGRHRQRLDKIDRENPHEL